MAMRYSSTKNLNVENVNETVSKTSGKVFYSLFLVDPISGDSLLVGCSEGTGKRLQVLLKDHCPLLQSCSLSFEFFSKVLDDSSKIGGFKAFCFNVSDPV